jgi:hypothetical protein
VTMTRAPATSASGAANRESGAADMSGPPFVPECALRNKIAP